MSRLDSKAQLRDEVDCEPRYVIVVGVGWRGMQDEIPPYILRKYPVGSTRVLSAQREEFRNETLDSTCDGKFAMEAVETGVHR